MYLDNLNPSSPILHLSYSQVNQLTLSLVHQLHLSVMGYSGLVHKVVIDLLATHRTMCKLSSVLFAVFATLFTKVKTPSVNFALLVN